jgi:hypothetical protein
MAIIRRHLDPACNFTARAAAADAETGFRFDDANLHTGRFDAGWEVHVHEGECAEIRFLCAAQTRHVTVHDRHQGLLYPLVLQDHFAVFDREAPELAQIAHAKQCHIAHAILENKAGHIVDLDSVDLDISQ